MIRMNYLLMKLLLIFLIICTSARCYASFDDFDEGLDEGEYPEHVDSLHEEMNQIKDLPPDEAKAQLKKLISKIDTSNDGFVDNAELHAWILDSLKKMDQNEAEHHLKENDENNDGFVTFEEYLKRSFGYTTQELDELRRETSEESQNFLKSINEDAEKFKMADVNKDQKLDLIEFAAFRHPSQYDHMKEFETMVHMDHFDRNKDGSISLEEFALSDDPTQVAAEKVHFDTFDKNKDGKLDLQEVREWATPGYENTAKQETEHLFEQTDLNRDNKLDQDEILNDYETWLASHATDYGEHLNKLKRDEL